MYTLAGRRKHWLWCQVGRGRNSSKKEEQILVLTFIVILGGDSKDGVLNILIFIHFRLVECLVEVRWVVILVSDADPDELCDWKKKERNELGKRLTKDFDAFSDGTFQHSVCNRERILKCNLSFDFIQLTVLFSIRP